ncbi:MAG TPA: ribose-phosphate pyrophosphokinase [Dehalococcoidia bacterium]|nr:ribose-phosphate pyrophosphokinase [Dehalococcoidia bacterium]
MYSDLAVFTGRAHPELARSICGHLETPLGACQVFEYGNENVFVKIEENVRGRDVFLVQPFVSPVNTRIMELLIMIDAFRRASAGRITAVIPYYAYGRSDKKDQPRVPITARLLANLIETAGADRVLTLDLHAGQIQGFFNVPVDELTATALVTSYFRRADISDLTVVATDAGSAKRARDVARVLGTPLAIGDKERLGNTGELVIHTLIGDVRGRTCLIAEDEIESGGTIVAMVNKLRAEGAGLIYVSCVHGLLTGPAVDRLSALQVAEVVTTDTVPISAEKRARLPNLVVLSVAPLIAEAIARIHSGRSVGELFQ